MTNKQPININFASGVDTKSDPWQVSPGKFQTLQNSVFQKGGLLSKRPGYGPLTNLPNQNYLTTFKGNLLGVGSTVSAYSSSSNTWVTKGTLQPASLAVLPLIRNNLNQQQADSVVSGGLICTAYTQFYDSTSAVVTNYLIAIADAVTGQNILKPTAIPVLSGGAISGSPRVFVVGAFFVVVAPVLIASTNFLQYVSIPINNANSVSAAQNVYPEAYVPISSNPGWDGTVTNNTLVVAYNTTAGAQGVHITPITAAQIAANQTSGVVFSFTGATNIAAIMSVCVDLTTNPNIIYLAFFNNSNSTVYLAAVYLGLGTVTQQFAPEGVASSTVALNLATAAQNGSCSVYIETQNFYSYDSTIPTSFIKSVTAGSNGSFTAGNVVRSCGLASKAFIVNGSIYFLAAYQSPFQPSYFLINATLSTYASPIVVAKLAYQNGGGYLTMGLPGVSVTANVAQIAYLYKQDVEAINTASNSQQTTTGAIYSQLGINLASFTIGTKSIDSAEIGSNLNLSGGYLGMFDGYLPVEQNFFLFPDSVEATYSTTSTVTPTGNTTNTSKVVTSVSSVSGIVPGMTITGTNIPAGTVIVLVGTTTLTLSNAATGSATGTTFTIRGNMAAQPDSITNTNAYYYQVTYEWTDMQGNAFRSQPSIPVGVTTTGSGTTGVATINIPTLRLTAKIDTPVKIVIYRWSVQTQAYNQVTSIFAPLLNSTTTDSVSFVDPYADSSVIGNNIIYTTGGVVPDTNGPASNIMSLFDTRLWLVDAEDPNLLWLSKSVVESAPVEMSSLFTIYVAPNTGTTGSTGPITALAPMDDKLIIFKQNAIYYINGVGPDNLGTTAVGSPLGNYSQPTFITSVVGCTNQASIVLTQDGLMFQSDKGIWIVNRSLQTSYIGSPVEQFNGSTVLSADVIPETNYVLFTLNTGQMLMYDYYYQQWGSFTGVPVVSGCLYNNLHTVINQYGQILQQTPNAYLDGTNPVLLSFTTSWFNLAGIQGYERFYDFYLLARYLSPHTLSVAVAYDYNSSLEHQSTIRPTNFSSSVPSSFGVPVPMGSPTQIEQWRIHAKKQLCESFQITVSENFDPSMGTVPGAGFTMSGLQARVGIKGGTRPIKASNAVG